MSWHSLVHGGLPGCTAGSACDGVLGSSWSLVYGILPVSVLAAGIYVSFIICLFLIDQAEESLRPLVWKVELAICGAVAGSAVWFTALQIFVLESFCKYCMTEHGLGLVLAVWMLRLSKGMRFRWPSFVAGLCLAGALAGFQMLTVDENAYYGGTSDAELPVLSEEEFPVLGGGPKTVFDGGPKTVVLMFDYQCPHCKKVHAAVREIVESHGDEYRFILCPTPLSNGCNPFIPAGKDYFPGSCEYARLALAVWHLAPEHFFEMDEFLWSGHDTDESKAFAAKLAGREQLETYLDSDKPFVTLSRAFELFGRTSVSDKSGLPRLVMGQSWIIPETSDPALLLEILAKGIKELQSK